MVKLENTLFVGNGLNRCLEGGIAWGDLLENIAIQLGVSYNKEIEMPLEFERIVNEFLKKSNGSRIDMSPTYYAIKAQISAAMQAPVTLGTCVHKSIPFNKIRNIITSNYDLILEQAYYETEKKTFAQGPIPKNVTKYLLGVTNDDEKIAFYHPHGIVTVPSTICLGYEHYMGLVERIRNSSNSKVKGSTKKPLPLPHELKIQRILNGKDSITNESWEKFYTSNLAFVGFGLWTCESDIWWLLTHRAYLYYSNYENIGDLIKNHITYYDIVNPRLSDVVEKDNHYELKNPRDYYSDKHKLLEGMHVEVRLRVVGPTQSYTDVYKSILDELKDEKSWSAPEDDIDD